MSEEDNKHDESQEQKPAEGISEVDRELEDIMENEAYDSDGVARGRSPGRPPSATGSVSSSGSGSRGKRRTWKKPKDKPKRPLSAYNLFFKHERQRIIDGKEESCSAEETIRSIENILSTSRETRRHRKTHGRISFGELARKIAEKWKAIGAEQKSVFEHYAELDLRRYRKEVKLWKERKENEAYAKQGMMDGSGSASLSSLDTDADLAFDSLANNNNVNSDDAWAPRRNFYDSMNSSFSSVDSEFSLEPIPIGDMLRNARPNMHNSMPNMNMNSSNGGIPGFVDTYDSMGNNQFNHNVSNFGQNSMSNMNFSSNNDPNMGMGGMGGPPLVISSVNPSSSELEQLRQQNELQQQQLQRQHQILMRQQQLLQQQLHQTNQMMNNAGMQVPMQVGSVSQNQGNNSFSGPEPNDLENYLSNLDLTNS